MPGAANPAIPAATHRIGVRRILTTDRRDFSTFGLKGGKRFELIDWL